MSTPNPNDSSNILGWDELEVLIKAYPASSKTAISSKHALLRLVHAAREWRLDPCIPGPPQIAKLFAINHMGKMAIRIGSREILDKAFKMAGTLSTRDLILAARRDLIERIPAAVDDDGHYSIELDRRQFERMRNLTRLSFNFELTEAGISQRSSDTGSKE